MPPPCTGESWIGGEESQRDVVVTPCDGVEEAIEATLDRSGVVIRRKRLELGPGVEAILPRDHQLCVGEFEIDPGGEVAKRPRQSGGVGGAHCAQ